MSMQYCSPSPASQEHWFQQRQDTSSFCREGCWCVSCLQGNRESKHAKPGYSNARSYPQMCADLRVTFMTSSSQTAPALAAWGNHGNSEKAMCFASDCVSCSALYGHPGRTQQPLHGQENGILEPSCSRDSEVAINLSTQKAKPTLPAFHSPARWYPTMENGAAQPSPKSAESAPSTEVSAAKVSTAAVSIPSTVGPPPKRKRSSSSEVSTLAMGPQQPMSPQQMQQLQVLAPGHLQQLMTHQSLLMQQQTQHKLHEQVLAQLNEQLQLNVLQQTQLMQTQTVGGKKLESKQVQQQLGQLQLQQQQLVSQIQQIQQIQRQFLLAQGIMGMPQFPNPQGLSLNEFQQLWKEITTQQQSAASGDEVTKATSNGMPPVSTPASLAQLQMLQSTPGAMPNGIHEGFLSHRGTAAQSSPTNSQDNDQRGSPPAKTHALYGHGVCKWPGCDTPCEDLQSFVKHLDTEHQLDDRSTAQARVQMQVVNQLELQLSKERERLQAMMQQLHMKQEDTPNGPTIKHDPPSNVGRPTDMTPLKPMLPKLPLPPPPPALIHIAPPIVSVPLPHPPHIPVMSSSPINLVTTSTPPSPPVVLHTHSSTPSSSPTTPTTPSTPTTLPSSRNGAAGTSCSGSMRRRVSDKCNLPISAEIQRNRDFYKTTDVRPPFTYASLIRQAINESVNRQLTLNEIYLWLQHNFAYFRRNEATWKNAVRHNLSLHKCFMRVENVKGAVWTVDEVEFYKRRPQKLTGNTSLKSPQGMQAANHVLFGETLNASLRAALAESNLLGNSGLSMEYEEGEYAEDLSVSRQQSGEQETELMETPEDLSNDANEHVRVISGEGHDTVVTFTSEAEAALSRLRADQFNRAQVASLVTSQNGDLINNMAEPNSSAASPQLQPAFVVGSSANTESSPLINEVVISTQMAGPGENDESQEGDAYHGDSAVLNIVPSEDSNVKVVTTASNIDTMETISHSSNPDI